MKTRVQLFHGSRSVKLYLCIRFQTQTRWHICNHVDIWLFEFEYEYQYSIQLLYITDNKQNIKEKLIRPKLKFSSSGS